MPLSLVAWRDRLVLLVMALLPWQARYIKESANLFGVPWEQGTTALFIVEVLLLAALGCHALAVATRCESRKASAPLWLEMFALLPFYAFISVFWAYDTTGALFSALRVFEGFALAYLLWVSNISIVSALTAFVFGVSVSSALGLWQFLTQSTFASSWLGLAAHPAYQAGTAVVETGGARLLRAYGTLPHPNILGGYAAAGLVAVAALASRPASKRPLLFLAAIVMGGALAASFSRSAWVAAMLALGVSVLLPRATATKEARQRATSVLLTAGLGALLVVCMTVPAFTARLTGQGRLETRSIAERSAALADGVELMLRYFSTGVGIGNYLPTSFLTLGVPDDPYVVQPPHFVPLLVAAELGFFGLAILVGALVAWWFSALWLMRRTGSPIVAFAAVLPIVVIVVSCFDHYPFDLFAGTMLTGACFGLFLKASEAETEVS